MENIKGDIFFGSMKRFEEVKKEFEGYSAKAIGENEIYRDYCKFIITNRNDKSEKYNLYVLWC